MGTCDFSGRLWVPAVDSVTIGLVHQLSAGWTLRLAHRHSGEDWSTCSSDVYSALVAAEALEAIDGTLSSIWRL